jgi:hypothetical protein
MASNVDMVYNKVGVLDVVIYNYMHGWQVFLFMVI